MVHLLPRRPVYRWKNVSEEKEERTGSREHVGGVRGTWEMMVKLDLRLGDVATFSAHVLRESIRA